MERISLKSLPPPAPLPAKCWERGFGSTDYTAELFSDSLIS